MLLCFCSKHNVFNAQKKINLDYYWKLRRKPAPYPSFELVPHGSIFVSRAIYAFVRATLILFSRVIDFPQGSNEA